MSTPTECPQGTNCKKYAANTNNAEVLFCSPRHSCGYCGKQEGELQTCGGCKNALHCSAECQKLAWKKHKPICSEMKAERKLAKSEGVSKVRTSSTAMKNNLSLESGQAVSRTAASGHGNASFYVSPKPSILPHTFSWKNNDSTAGKVCFTTLDQADPLMQFCLACTFLNDIAVAQRLLPDVLLSLPSHVSIGDLRVPGPDFRILDLACRFGNTEIVSWLCGDERTRCMVTAGTAVAWAVYTGQVEIAKLVVQHGADPTTTDSVCFGSKPPLFMAAENGQLLAMKWLVEEVGQDLNMRCPEHGSVLDACKAKGFGKSNMTPSHRACADWVHSKR